MDESSTSDETVTHQSASSHEELSSPEAYDDRLKKVEAENAALRERLDALETRLAEDDTEADTAASDRDRLASVSRRGALASLVGLGGLGLGLSRPARAQQHNAGRYLELDQGTLNFTGPAEWGNEGQFTNSASGGNATVGGGARNDATGTDATIAGGLLNTASDTHATVAGGHGNTASDWAATVGGGFDNTVQASFATVAGGGTTETADSGTANVVYDEFGTVGGGGNNQAGSDDGNPESSDFATVSGGEANTASGHDSTIGGGEDNTASATSTTVAGGHANTANATDATVSGGVGNDARGEGATVPGGRTNTAGGKFSVAAGKKAWAYHDGAVVIGDSTNASISSSSQDEMRVQQDLKAKSVSKEQVAAKMTLSHSQTIKSDGNSYRIKLDTVRFDDFGWADPNNHKFTVSGPATLQVGGTPTWTIINNIQRFLFRFEQDGDVIAQASPDPGSKFWPSGPSMTMLTRVPDGTTADITFWVDLHGQIDRELSSFTADNEFWVIKQG